MIVLVWGVILILLRQRVKTVWCVDAKTKLLALRQHEVELTDYSSVCREYMQVVPLLNTTEVADELRSFRSRVNGSISPVEYHRGS